jgi:hypothetical protein
VPPAVLPGNNAVVAHQNIPATGYLAMRVNVTIEDVGGKARRLWPLAAIALVIAVAGILVWLVWRSPHRGDLSTFGGFVVAVVAPVASLVVYLTKLRRHGGTGLGRPPGELADSLAAAVMEQWTQAARERRLVQPEPIPVRWGRSVKPLAGPVSAAVGSRQFPPLPGLPPAAAGRLRGGQLQDLHAVYGGLGSGRIVIIGGPGSGKSGAAILLILAALKYRAQMTDEDRQLVPVPVLVTVHGWDPGTERVGQWLAGRLQQTYPLFAGRGGLEAAAELVRTARIAAILDGLDEIPEELRPPALRALSDQADFRVVVLSRSDEMAAAASEEFLQGAVVLELQDVGPKVAADYLTRVQRHPAPAGWGELTGRLRRAPGSPIARALSLPLTLTLVRDTYRGGDDVGELLDFCDAGDHGASRESIEDYLLDRVLPAAYAPRPGEPPARYGLPAARLALGHVAARMNRDGTRDLAWWRIPAWVSIAPRVIATALVFGLLFWLGGGPKLGLVAVPLAALGYLAGLRDKSPRRLAPLRWRQLFSRSSLAVGLQFALVGGLFGGLIYGLASGPTAGRTVGLVAAAATGLAGTLSAGLSQPAADDASPLTPPASWHRDQVFGLIVGLVFGISIGLGLSFILAARHVLGLLPALGYGLVGGVVFGAVWGLSFPLTWTASLAFAQLAIRWRTPARLLRFLEDARQRDVLRTVGPVYQFRHARLQDRLAGQAARK